MSIFDPIVAIDSSGKIEVKMKSYPRYNVAGEENRFCPTTGNELILIINPKLNSLNVSFVCEYDNTGSKKRISIVFFILQIKRV